MLRSWGLRGGDCGRGNKANMPRRLNDCRQSQTRAERSGAAVRTQDAQIGNEPMAARRWRFVRVTTESDVADARGPHGGTARLHRFEQQEVTWPRNVKRDMRERSVQYECVGEKDCLAKMSPRSCQLPLPVPRPAMTTNRSNADGPCGGTPSGPVCP